MLHKFFKLTTGFMIIVSVQYACNCIIKFLHILVPAPVLGIIVLTILIQTGVIKKEYIKDICDILLKYMSILFVPLFVGITVYYGIIEKNLIPILLILLFTATLTILITAIIVENIIKFVRLSHMGKQDNE